MGATEVPSIIFTDATGDTKHLYVGGNEMGAITLEGVTKILDDIIDFNKMGIMGKFQSSKVFDGFQQYSVNGKQAQHIVNLYTVMV